jgi:hypothetical protein
MEGISDIRITGIDEQRPPKMRKEPYIDLYFKLSHKAPPDWCKDFNDSLTRHPSAPKIKPEEGLFIATWVRHPDEVDAHLKLLQAKVAECTERYIKRIELERQSAKDAGADLAEGAGEQGRLNRIIAGLDFGKPAE